MRFALVDQGSLPHCSTYSTKSGESITPPKASGTHFHWSNARTDLKKTVSPEHTFFINDAIVTIPTFYPPPQSVICSIFAWKALDSLLPSQRLHLYSFIELLSKQLW